MGTPKRPFRGHRTKLLWNANSWLPDNYKEPLSMFTSLSDSLSKRYFYNPYLVGFGHPDIFSDDVVDGYYMYHRLYGFHRLEGSARNIMLVKLVLMALNDKHREIRFVIITRLAQEDREMICRVVASLKSRGCRVLFAVPDLLGFNVFSEQNDVIERIPVWLCPHLFDQVPGEDQVYVIEPPPPDAHTMKFSMFQGVHTCGVRTCVFWDVDDYPLPLGLQLPMFFENIKSALRAHHPSFCGDLSIYAYVVKEEEFDYEEDGITITVVRKAPADRFSRLAKMTMDFLLWSMDNPGDLSDPGGPNLLIISKLLEYDLGSVFVSLSLRGHNVFLAQPAAEKTPPPVHVMLMSWKTYQQLESARAERILILMANFLSAFTFIILCCVWLVFGSCLLLTPKCLISFQVICFFSLFNS